MNDQNDGRSDAENDLQALRRRIADLDEQVARDQAAPEPAPMGRALQLGVDMAAGVGVGAIIGLIADRALGSSPWLMVAFLFVGFAAGVRNVIRRAAEFGVEADAKNSDTDDA